MLTTNPFSPVQPNQIIDVVAKWYDSYLPRIGSRDFREFALGSHTMVQLVCGIGDFKIHLKPAATSASADAEARVVNLPDMYFSREFWTRMYQYAGFPEVEDEAITAAALVAVNGSSVHEGLHLRHTNPSLAAARKWEPITFTKYGDHLLSTMNSVEDLFMEDTVYGTPIGDFVHAKNALLNNPLIGADTIENFVHYPDLDELASVLALLKNCSARTLPCWSATPFMKQLFATTMRSLGMTDREARVHLAGEIVRLFEAPATAPKENTDENELSTEEGSESAVVKEIAASAVVAKEAKSEASKAKHESAVESSDGTVPAIVEYDITEYPFTSREFTPYDAHGFDEFARTLKQLQARNHAPGQPRTTGSTLVGTRLSRIVTDGKIFARQDAHKPQPRIEVVVLLDASGSMSDKLWSPVIGAAEKLYKSLRSAGIPCSFYFHTSQPDNTTPTLCHIVSSGMGSTSSNAQGRLERLRRIRLIQNFDGYALSKVATKFTARANRKVLISLSDGEPRGHNYRDTRAIQHTKEVVTELSKRNVTVISLSLTSTVVTANDNIYGAERNVEATTPELLSSGIKRVITNVIKETVK